MRKVNRKIKEFCESANVTLCLSFILWMKVKISSRDCAHCEFPEDVAATTCGAISAWRFARPTCSGSGFRSFRVEQSAG